MRSRVVDLNRQAGCSMQNLRAEELKHGWTNVCLIASKPMPGKRLSKMSRLRNI
jgi:hypothetical protein